MSKFSVLEDAKIKIVVREEGQTSIIKTFNINVEHVAHG